MNTRNLENFVVTLPPDARSAWEARGIVYVRPTTAGELRPIVEGLDDVPDDMRLYAIHASDGTPMAVLDNRDAAFVTARENEMVPVSVH